MKSITMKLFINVSCIFIMVLSFSSITSAQGSQQRPSQRSFATVIAKIMEKKKGRDRMQEQTKQTENKIEGTHNPDPKGLVITSPDPKQLPSRQPLKTHPAQSKTAGAPVNNAPDPNLLPSRQPMKIPVKPRTN